ncbi:MAG: FAD-dependent oxidoreductase [Limnohabitans sp.]|nr:FAD-dependent oxidoreductase [Limnohabitans sp.]
MKISVIGAGVIGVTTALELVSHGHEVVVYEKGSGIAQQASFAASGFMGPGLVNAWTAPGMFSHQFKKWFLGESGIRVNSFLDIPVAWIWQWLRACRHPEFNLKLASLQRLAFYSQEVFKGVTEQYGLSYENSQGTLLLCRSETDLQDVELQLSLLKEAGIHYKALSATQTRALEPALSTETELWGSVCFPHDAVANCRQFTILAKQEAEQLGVVFKTGHEVLPLSASRPLHIQIADQEPALFDHVIVCAGVHSRDLVHKLGIHLPVQEVHGYSLSAALREELDAPACGVLDARHQVAIARSGQRIRVSGMCEIGQARKPSEENTSLLYKVLNDWFAGAARTQENVQVWRGTRDVMCDGVPVLGLSGVPGVWLNTGHGNHGWACSSGSARAIADMVSGRDCEIDLKGLGIERF